jgi:hypothetical protein
MAINSIVRDSKLRRRYCSFGAATITQSKEIKLNPRFLTAAFALSALIVAPNQIAQAQAAAAKPEIVAAEVKKSG